MFAGGIQNQSQVQLNNSARYHPVTAEHTQ